MRRSTTWLVVFFFCHLLWIIYRYPGVPEGANIAAEFLSLAISAAAWAFATMLLVMLWSFLRPRYDADALFRYDPNTITSEEANAIARLLGHMRGIDGVRVEIDTPTKGPTRIGAP